MEQMCCRRADVLTTLSDTILSLTDCRHERKMPVTWYKAEFSGAFRFSLHFTNAINAMYKRTVSVSGRDGVG